MQRQSKKRRSGKEASSSDPSSSNPSTRSSSDFLALTRYSHDVILLQNQVISALHLNHKLLQEAEKNGYFEQPPSAKRQNCVLKEVSQLLNEDGLINADTRRGIRLQDCNSTLAKSKRLFKDNYLPEKSLAQKLLRENQLSSKSNYEAQEQAYFQYKRENYSKNLIKQFAQAILSFIRGNFRLKRKVLRELAIAEGQFQRACAEFQDMVESFSDFKLLWTSQGNPFHKAFRILSYKYLRENCLQEIIISRVQNPLTHLKCRTLLLEGLAFPHQLTIFKAY